MKFFLFLILCAALVVSGRFVYNNYIIGAGPSSRSTMPSVKAESVASTASMVPMVAVTYPNAPQLNAPQPETKAVAEKIAAEPKKELVPGQWTTEALRSLPTSKWPTEEAEKNKQLFFECYQAEIRAAMKEIQSQIDYYERELAQNKHLEEGEDRKIEKCNQFLKKAQELVKADQFPAKIDGEEISKEDLQSLRLSYNSLRAEAREQKTQYANMVSIAQTQLDLLRPEIQKKKADLESSGIYIKKLAAKEKIDNMRAIFESLQVGKSLAETLDDSLTNTFVEEDIKHEAQKVQEKEELDQLDNEVLQ